MRADIPQPGDPAEPANGIGVLLNADLGEGSEHDREIMRLIDIANIACAAHAGSAQLMQRTIELAIEHDVQICAHPGYPDRENFGRLSMPLSSEAFSAMLLPQLQRMLTALAPHQRPLRLIKPHGALYNDCASDAALSAQFVRLCKQVVGEVTIIGLAGSQLIAQARAAGLSSYAEGFGDRRYLGNGQLAPRDMPGACIDDIEIAAQQAMQLVEQQRVTTVDGAIITMSVDTLCVHGDSNMALALATRLSQQLKTGGHVRAIELLCPVWPAPANVVAGVTTRVGGASKVPYASLNLARHVNDANHHVTSNRAQLKRFCRTELCDPMTRRTPPLAQRWHWLNQTHSNRVIDLSSLGEQAQKQLPDADAAITSMQQQVCVVLTADCLPILLCDRNGTRVCAVHAGWRGLLGGVIDNAVAALCSQTRAPAAPAGQPALQPTQPEQLLAWLGPAIGPRHFIVGDDVRQRARAYFECDDAGAAGGGESAFATACNESGDDKQAGEKYTADIYQLATLALHRLGIVHIYGGGFCTASDPQRFFSYRRDGETGRMASFILLNGPSNPG